MVFPFLTGSSELPKLRKEDQKARNALLADIQQGTRLRKVTQINDRSAPQIEKPKETNRDGVNQAINKGSSQQPLGGLFAGGFPVLRPAGQRDMPGGRPGQLPGLHKPSSIQSLPLPPTPGLPQPAVAETRRKRAGRGAGPGAGKLVTPPQPPARSPTTELTSKSGGSAWAAAHDPYPPLKNGNMHIIDDFESKFTFHSMEDFPPPDEFKPFQKIYPSKIARDPSKNPPLRTHVR
ncbi:WAS/WASL-interacting protein family member 3 isoform B [Patagioenas fasciata monilis]|uniref:WAS/WASL-interacting protein family member 3 isoform B n=1 Tax=Patagioenas fasciata monilis TaxID=372326 RepID=A0A1V4KBY8_PATFA|nr:WAS/WASL-interacting protein family member 3 isoform B [Patagioenas fasciata monilis]